MSAIWVEADKVAQAWTCSPYTKPFREGLRPTPAGEDGDPLAVTSVHEILVRYEMLKSQPMLAATRVQWLPEFHELAGTSAAVESWLDIGRRFAFALLELVEYLRSRLPGYPQILVPDLLSGAPLVYQDGFWDRQFPWPHEARAAGLQLKGPPEMLSQSLGLIAADRAYFYSALAELLEAVRCSQSWRRFEAADAALAPAERDDARARRRRYRDVVTDDQLTAVAGENGMRRQAARRAELGRVKVDADGSLLEYYEAFAAVDALIGAVAAWLSHRIAKGTIPEVEVQEAEWGSPAELRPVRFKALDDDFRHPLELVWFEDTIDGLGGAVVLHNLNIDFGEAIILQATGDLLVGSSAAPRVFPGN
jgi:hypothetical protein